MSAFIKYRSLENHYQVKMEYMNLAELVTVSEKVDGSNISIAVSKDGEMIFASRNQQIDQHWNNIGQFIDTTMIARVVRYAVDNQVQVNLFGEIFSSTILRRIAYGSPKVLFFDLAINGEYVSGEFFESFVTELNIPVIPFKIMSLSDALAINVEGLRSDYVKPETNVKCQAEGIVIKSYKQPEFNSKIGAIKKKADAFLEKSNQGKDIKSAAELSDDEAKYISLLNENRMLSYISKHGEITNMSQMGEYIKGIMMDAKEEFLKDLDDEEQNEIDNSIFKKGGTIISKLLVNRLKSI